MAAANSPLPVVDADGVARLLRADDRVAALRRSRLLDAPPQESFDRVTRLASRYLNVPIVLVNVVDVDRQFFKSAVGVPAEIRELPLTHSVCKYVAANDEPLVINSAADTPLVADNALVRDLGIQTYCGVPLRDGDGNVLGTFCAMDIQAHEWSEDEIGVLRDLAEIVRSEIILRASLASQQEAERRREDVIGVLAHDLRSPLGVISTGSSTLARSWERIGADARQGLLDSLDRQADRAGQLVDRLLLADGRSPVVIRQSVDVAREVEEFMTDRRITAPDASFVVDVGEPGTIDCDPTLLRQVIGNLVDNALAHAGPAVTVTVASHGTDDGIQLLVSDDGVGMDDEAQATLFDRFARGRDSHGHGLGMHIVRRIVEELGGTIEVRSALGEGTTFEILLPVPGPGAGSDASASPEVASV